MKHDIKNHCDVNALRWHSNERVSVKGFLSICLFIICTPVIADEIAINQKIPVEGEGRTYISGPGFKNQAVTYEVKNGLAIVEGDIVLGTVKQAESWRAVHEEQRSDKKLDGHGRLGGDDTKSIIITGQGFRWINNLMPFQFGPDLEPGARALLEDAMAHWEINTHIRFIERTPANAAEHPDFVELITRDQACWSFVGRRGGEQELNLAAICGFGAAVHEIGHALGLWHEQSREDRNEFVQINFDNIEEGREHNFDQHIGDGDDVGVYDYGSIMHYGAHAFSSNGLPTITPLQSATIGQRNGLSVLDIESIVQNYPEFQPEAILDKEHYSVFLGRSLTFDGSESFDPNGTIINYFWSLGDGAIGYGPNDMFTHTYQSRGNYQMSLLVTDAQGMFDSDMATVSVYGAEVLVPVIALLL